MFALNTCSNSAVVFFDGYDDMSSSTKAHEQSCCVLRNNGSPDSLCTYGMPVTCSKDDFLSNNKNKARLTSSLIDALNGEGIACKQRKCDADFLICNTAIEHAESSDQPVIVVSKDTDLLVMLVGRSKPYLYIKYATNCICSIYKIRQSLHMSVKKIASHCMILFDATVFPQYTH